MKIYCIDIGNTRTHCSVVRYDGVDKFKIVSRCDFPTAGFPARFADENLFSESGADAAAWCSVVPKISAEFEKSKIDAPSMQLTHLNSPLRLDVKSPEQVGHDRIADAVGAGLFFKPPYIVVDMGTAVTIDLVDEFGNYAGGIIAPGMHAFSDYLSERAAQLPRINPADADYSLTIGKNTMEAMSVGCVKGFCRLADGLLSDIEKEFFGGKSARDKTVFTGGSVDLLPKKWLADRFMEPNLAELGLSYSFVWNNQR